MSRENNRARAGGERTLPLVVLGEIVIMPHMTVPLQVGQGKSYRAMEQAMQEDRQVLLIFVSEAEIEGYKGHEQQDLPAIGVIARLEDFTQLPDGTVKIVLEGLTRASITDCVQSEPFYRVTCRAIPDNEPEGMQVEALMETVKQQISDFVDFLGEVPPEAIAFVHRITTPGHLADLVTYGPAFDFQDRLRLLNTIDPMDRLNHVQSILARQLELLRLRAKIQSETKDVLDQSQKEYFLREQMRVIRKELGEDDDDGDPIDELRRKVAELDAPQYVKDQALHEIKRL
ncbi:MAG TPA: LON peptidase substrate-binding domain-containing protein, partial [Herpetosiphonaceae bacterium]